ncbi:type VI immunity family protein [Pseudoduganella sp. HUAS MS19]
MPIRSPEVFTRTQYFGGQPKVIVRPSVSMVFYTRANYVALKAAVARALDAYLGLVPPNAIAAVKERFMDPVTGSDWSPFDDAARQTVFNALGNTPDDEEGHFLVLSATLDGQAGDYGLRFSGINFDLAENAEKAESVLRLDFPWDWVERNTADTTVAMFEKFAKLFPTCSGHAGMSYIHPTTFMPQSGDEIEQLAQRFLGFDLGHDFVARQMRGKVLTAHWLNLLDADRVTALGGEDEIRRALASCELRKVGTGLLIRSTKLPPVVDRNRLGPDIGKLPDVARLIEPILYPNGYYVGMNETATAEAWLRRYDGLAAGDWDNA